MTGREFVEWIKKNHAEDDPIVVLRIHGIVGMLDEATSVVLVDKCDAINVQSEDCERAIFIS